MMMLPMLAGTLSMAMMFAGQRGGTFADVTVVGPGLSAIGMLASQFGQHAGGVSKQDMLRNRREYLRHLSQQRRRARKAATDQRRTLLYRHPHPHSLWTVADSPRVWECRSMTATLSNTRTEGAQQPLRFAMRPGFARKGWRCPRARTMWCPAVTRFR